jgi:hypothetical protein
MKRFGILLAVLMIALSVAAREDSTMVVLGNPSNFFLEAIIHSMSNGVSDTIIVEKGQEVYLNLEAFFGHPKYKNRNFEFRNARLIAYKHSVKWKKAEIQWVIRYFGDKDLALYWGQRVIKNKFKKWSTTEWELPAKAPSKKSVTVAYLELVNQTTGPIFTPMLEWENKRWLEIEPGAIKTVRVLRSDPIRLEVAGQVKLKDGRWQPTAIIMQLPAACRQAAVTEEYFKRVLLWQGSINNFSPKWIKITGDTTGWIEPNGMMAVSILNGECLRGNAGFFTSPDSPMPIRNQQFALIAGKTPEYHWSKLVYFYLDLRGQ